MRSRTTIPEDGRIRTNIEAIRNLGLFGYVSYKFAIRSLHASVPSAII
jgi:hypothetical protein